MVYNRTMTARSAQNFFQRAEKEANRYGDDPWVFLRELVQNSRDAGATTIEVDASCRDGWENITCRDNGEGMTEEDFKAYFLRLYASSKETDPSSIGFFGVGFWSTLLFEPSKIVVSSFRDGVALAFEIEPATTQIRSVLPENTAPGTCITLIRRAGYEDEAAFVEKVRERLVYYAGFVRPAKKGAKLDLLSNGAQINGDLPAPKQWGKAFKNNTFDGVISFGKLPYVRIYKGGILVRDLVSLNEVVPSRKSSLPDGGWSLHPEILINIDSLQVLMDRQKVFEDPLLYKAVVYCENQLLRCHKRLVRDMFPMNIKNTFLRLTANSGWPRIVTMFLLIAAGFLGAFFLRDQFTAASADGATDGGVHAGAFPSSEPSHTTVDRAFMAWGGSIIDNQRQDSQIQWGVRYEGTQDLNFRICTFAKFDPGTGLGPEAHRYLGEYPSLPRAGGRSVTVSLSLSGLDQWTILPLPPGYAVDVTSVRTAGGLLLRTGINQFREPLVRVGSAQTITYEVFPCEAQLESPFAGNQGAAVWPAAYKDQLARVKSMDNVRAAQELIRFVENNFEYTRDAEAAKRFNRDARLWVEKTIDSGRGDCDVINGLLVMLLRSAGIQAYLWIGLVGNSGRVNSDLHAWVRYFDGAWKDVDVSNLYRSSRGLMAGAPDLPAISVATSEGPTPRQPAINSPGWIQLPRVSVSPSWFLLLALPLVYFIWRLVRGRGRPQVERSRYVVDLFQHFFTHGRANDAFGLQFRPVFPLLSGKAISLFELQNQADRGHLLGAAATCNLTRQLPAGLPVLDRSAEIVSALQPFLPAVTWLDEVEVIASPNPKPAGLVGVEKSIHRLDPEFRLHVMAGSDEFGELLLPLKVTSLGKRHLLLGDRHPLYRQLASHDPDDEWAHFDALQLLLSRTTFYLNEKDNFLMQLATAGRIGNP